MANSRGDNRRCLERVVYYAELAESFSYASTSTDLPAKATLVYYCMLNLVKAFISKQGVKLETTYEHHGIQLPQGEKQKVIVPKPETGLSIFAEFARLLGTPVNNKTTISLKNILANIPEIHEIVYALGQLPWSKRKFLPIEIDFLVNDSVTCLFTEAKYEKKCKTLNQVDRFLQGKRAGYFIEMEESDGYCIFRSKKRKKLTKQNWDRLYKNIQTEYSAFNIGSILTRDGYRFYCDLRPGNFHHLCNSLMAMYYLGSIARYRPSEYEEVMYNSPFRPILAEVIATCPSQFLYHMVSLTTDCICVVPHAKVL